MRTMRSPLLICTPVQLGHLGRSEFRAHSYHALFAHIDPSVACVFCRDSRAHERDSEGPYISHYRLHAH